jgi:hypothetical protein
MVLKTTAIGLLAAMLQAVCLAQSTPKTAPESLPPLVGCGPATQVSTFITPSALVEVKDIPLCFDPAFIQITHPQAQAAAYGHLTTIVDTTPSVRPLTTVFQSTRNAPPVVIAVAPGASGWSGSAVTVNFDGQWSTAAQIAVPVVLRGASASYTVSVHNPPDLSATFPIGSGTTILGFTDMTGHPIFVPADPSLPVQNGEWNGAGREGLFNFLLHTDQLGAYGAAITVSGRRLRAIIMRSRHMGAAADSLAAHHHIQVLGKGGEQADIDLDQEAIQPPALYPGSPTEPACPLLTRRFVTEAPASELRAFGVNARSVGRADHAQIPPPTQASGILPLRI